jgi:sec-independent protein translocase protein TatA
MPDWALVAIIGVVVIFGASKLPEIARNLGRSSGEFKKGLKEGDGEVKPVTSADTAPASPTPTPPASSPTDPPRTDTRPETTP